MRSLTVLAFFDSMVTSAAQNLLFSDYRMLHAVNQCPADSRAASSVDKSVLRAGVQGIFPIHELRMEDDIALLVG